jgi:hypothetical protein
VLWYANPTLEQIDECKARVQKALSLDENESEAHRIMGAMSLHRDRKYDRAEYHMTKAVSLNPNDANTAAKVAELFSFTCFLFIFNIPATTHLTSGAWHQMQSRCRQAKRGRDERTASVFSYEDDRGLALPMQAWVVTANRGDNCSPTGRCSRKEFNKSQTRLVGMALFCTHTG